MSDTTLDNSIATLLATPTLGRTFLHKVSDKMPFTVCWALLVLVPLDRAMEACFTIVLFLCDETFLDLQVLHVLHESKFRSYVVIQNVNKLAWISDDVFGHSTLVCIHVRS